MPRSRKSDEEVENNEAEVGGPDAASDDDLEDDQFGDEEEEDEEEAVAVTAAAKASALRLLDLLVEKKGLALHAKKPGPKLIESVARLLESPLPLKTRANKLSDEIVDSEDVDELFVDDETLIELLKRW